MTLRAIDLHLEIGQEILVGKSKTPAKVTKIEYFERSGEVIIGTTEGSRSALTFALSNNTNNADETCVADKYR